MTQKRSFITLTAEQSIAWYQHHVMVMHGYALALALKAGLSPAEAARVFVEQGCSGGGTLRLQATAQVLERQAWQIAEVLALTYGEEYVRVEQEGEVWLVRVEIVDREPFERYGASVELHTQWVAEQLRQICEPKGIVCAVWLDGNVQCTRLSLQPLE